MTSEIKNEYLNDPILRHAFTRQPKNENPLQLNEFKFVLHRTPHIVYFCQSVNLPGVSIGETQLPTLFSTKVRRPGNNLEQANLTLRFIVNEDMTNWFEIRNWMKYLSNERDFNAPGNSHERDRYSDATLLLMNSKSNAFISVSFQDCFPIGFSDILFDTTITDVSPATCEVQFAYTGYVPTYIVG